MTTIWWLRRDLRLGDNQALAAALAHGGRVIPVFVVDPELRALRHHRGAARREGFLRAGLAALAADLCRRGSRLVVRAGRSADVLGALARESGAEAVVAEGDVSPYARRRDATVARVVPLELVGGPSVRRPDEVVKADGRPYTVFTPFRRAWLARGLPRRRDLIRAPGTLPAVPAAVRSDPLPAGAVSSPFPAGEAEARRRLYAFTRGRGAKLHAYAAARDRLDLDGTSALSPYLRFGMVSAREAVAEAAEARARKPSAARAGADAWLDELVWREFYLAILFHFPRVLGGALDARFERMRWRRAPAALRAWQQGRTGFPIVDAAMRQLAATGWMPNRARMLVASFLVKDLLIDWRAGEAWFMEALVDGDPAANSGGWQWTAGVGTDASPYFRIFNPVRQAKRFDPDGAYVRRWIPELARVSAGRVHEPWRLTPSEQRAAGCVVGRDYPARIVEREAVRGRTLATYEEARTKRR